MLVVGREFPGVGVGGESGDALVLDIKVVDEAGGGDRDWVAVEMDHAELIGVALGQGRREVGKRVPGDDDRALGQFPINLFHECGDMGRIECR